MKRAILAIVILAVLGTAAVWACVSDPQGKFYHDQQGPYCGGGGHGCVECDAYDQSGDFLTCYHSAGVTYCYGSTGGHPYTI